MDPRSRAPRRRNDTVPLIPDEIIPDQLDGDIARQLRTLPKGLAEEVARRLVMAGLLLAEDPETAHLHALEATRIASRVAAVREATGVTAYASGRWAQALAELRAARRMSGSDDFLPIMADCERGLGRPERALALAGSPEAARLDTAGRIEMRIVASGARRDLGQLDAAVVTLRCSELNDKRSPWAARLRYAYADALETVGDATGALEWFSKAAAVDTDGETEAAERMADLQGVTFEDLGDEDFEGEVFEDFEGAGPEGRRGDPGDGADRPVIDSRDRNDSELHPVATPLGEDGADEGAAEAVAVLRMADPAADEPVSEPAAIEPVGSEPVGSEPVGSEPVASEPVASESIVPDRAALAPVPFAAPPEPLTEPLPVIERPHAEMLALVFESEPLAPADLSTRDELEAGAPEPDEAR